MGPTEGLDGFVYPPTWRTIILDDMPPITMEKLEGILPIAKGGTGIATSIHPNRVLSTASSGEEEEAPSWRHLVPDDIPQLNVSKIDLEIIPVEHGGTGYGTITLNKMLIGDNENKYKFIETTKIGRDMLTMASVPANNLVFYSYVDDSVSITELTEFIRLQLFRINQANKDKFWYFSDTNTFTETPIYKFGRDFLDQNITVPVKSVMFTTAENKFGSTPISAMGKQFLNWNPTDGAIDLDDEQMLVWTYPNTLIGYPITNFGKQLINSGIHKDMVWYGEDLNVLGELPISILGKWLLNSAVTPNAMWYADAANQFTYILNTTAIGRKLLTVTPTAEKQILVTDAAKDFNPYTLSVLGYKLLTSAITKDYIWYGSDTNTLGQTPISVMGLSLLNATIALNELLIGTGTNTFGKLATNAMGRLLLNTTVAAEKLFYCDTENNFSPLTIKAAGRSLIAIATVPINHMYYASAANTISTVVTTEYGRALLNVASNAVEVDLWAKSATTLHTTRKLWGNDFNGSADVDGSMKFANTAVLTPTNTNYVSIGTDALKFKEVYATTFYGSFTGNASSATKLQTARSLWGNSFDGTADISGDITLAINKSILLANTSTASYIGSAAFKFTNVYSTAFTGALVGNADTATVLQTARNLWGNSFNGSAAIDGTITLATNKSLLLAAVSTAAYIGSSTIPFTNIYSTTFTGALSGNASSATVLQTARNLWGNSFNGSAAIDGSIVLALNKSITLASVSTAAYIGSSTVPFTNIYSTTFTGAFAGNASSATVLQTSRTIWGNNFNGSANVDGDLKLPDGKTIIPVVNNTDYVGTSSYKFLAMYATTFYGALSGNADSATTAGKLTTAKQDNEVWGCERIVYNRIESNLVIFKQ
jgi:hypothetical protein